MTSISQAQICADKHLDDWIAAFSASEAYAAKVRSHEGRSAMCPPQETAMICGLIEHMQPELVLEIGTFFAETSRLMAESVQIAGRGRLLTIDPFGAERAPGLIAAWPDALRAVTDFRAINSMECFSVLEQRSMLRRDLGLCFVDGNHKFEYALFDMLSAADNLAAGGAIVVDNMEQEGPKRAVLAFLTMNPAWTCFYNDRVWRPGDIHFSDLRPTETRNTAWSVLVAPPFIQVAAKGFKSEARLAIAKPPMGVAFNIAHVARKTVATANFMYVAAPYDYHLTGSGLFVARRVSGLTIADAGERVVVLFEPPIVFDALGADMNYRFELELTLEDAAVVGLDGQTPFELLFD